MPARGNVLPLGKLGLFAADIQALARLGRIAAAAVTRALTKPGTPDRAGADHRRK